MTVRRADLTPRVTVAPPAVLPGSVSCTYLSGILQYAVACGASRRELLTASGLTEATLDTPDARAPLDTARQLFDAAARQLDQPAFALSFGVGVPCTTLTLAAALAAAQPPAATACATEGRPEARTLRDALNGLNRYASLGVDFGPRSPAQRYAFVESAEGVWLEDRRPDHREGCAWPALTESVFARFATGIRKRGGEQIVRALHVTHAPPTNEAHRAAYATVFRVPVTFGAVRNALCLDPAFLEQPLDPLPAPVERVLTAHADRQLRALPYHASWRDRVESVLMTTPAIDCARVCRELAVSRQTLHRRLRDEGTTFLTLQNAARRALADQMLRHERLSVTAVAARLGFSEPAAFSRAYKRWTGARPSATISG